MKHLKTSVIVWSVICGTLVLGKRDAHATIGACTFFATPYQTEIKAKIQAGVPFELMGALFEDGRLVSKKVVHIGFNLWDEVVTVKSDDLVLAKFALEEAPRELCKYVEINDALTTGKKYVFRLLLNPMWGERMERLQVSGGRAAETNHILGIDWKRLAEDMPSEKVLLEKAIQE